MIKHLALIVGLTISSVPLVSAQEVDGQAGGGAYGYISVSFDSASNTVAIYAETDADPENDAYYSPDVSLSVSNKQGFVLDDSNSLCRKDTDDSSYASISCSIPAVANNLYSATANHWMLVAPDNQDYAFPITSFYDNFGYDSFASADIDSPFGQSFEPPYIVYKVRQRRINLGQTTDSASTGSRPFCGDVRDLVIAEYYSFESSFSMVDCNDFSWIINYSNPGGFTFLDLTPTQSTGKGQFAILQSYMAYLLRATFNNLGYSPVITSAYRNPAQEACCTGHYYPNSRHMAGDAVDLRTGGDPIVFKQQVDAGHTALACAEPYLFQKNYAHTHLDWRTYSVYTGTFDTSHFPGPKSCPRGW